MEMQGRPVEDAQAEAHPDGGQGVETADAAKAAPVVDSGLDGPALIVRAVFLLTFQAIVALAGTFSGPRLAVAPAVGERVGLLLVFPGLADGGEHFPGEPLLEGERLGLVAAAEKEVEALLGKGEH